MLRKFINFFKDENYSVLISNTGLYICNYEKVLDITSENLKVNIKDKLLVVTGEDIIIKKLDKSELLINGTIKKVEFNDR